MSVQSNGRLNLIKKSRRSACAAEQQSIDPRDPSNLDQLIKKQQK